jgi:hypothetical protein
MHHIFLQNIARLNLFKKLEVYGGFAMKEWKRAKLFILSVP